MSEQIDPNDEEYNKERERFWIREGEHVFQAVAMERGQASRGHPTLTIHAVCLDDPDPPDPNLNPPSDVGLLSRVKFTINEGGGKAYFVRATKAFGRTTPFDPFSDDDIMAIFFDKPFIANVKHNPGDRGAIFTDLDNFRLYKKQPDASWAGIVDAGVDRFNEMVRRREEKAAARAQQPQSGRGGGRNRRGGGGGGGRGGGGGEEDTVSKYGF